MYEIRFHGRGGQGAVVASVVLASAFFKEGKFVQAFPSFGAERRGAPVVSFVRVNDREIRHRFGIYHPDSLIILDSSLTHRKDITTGLKQGHWIIVNSDQKPETFSGLGPYRIATLDANSISLKYGLGSPAVPIVNTTILGAFSRVTEAVKIESVLEAVSENAPSKPKNNMKAAQEAYEAVIF
ncbi:MAG: 2-oxoacid:acceptor oxidoreductase family protein [Thermodesulfobacteriota bacterium]